MTRMVAAPVVATGTRGRVLDLAIGSGLAALVLLVHDVGYLLRTPYWLDESWVAVSTKVSWAAVPRVAASSPLGWTLALRGVPGSGAERQRLVPLAGAAAVVLLGFLLLRSFGVGRFGAVLAGGGPALLAPVMLIRDDLKQYTADAAVFVLSWLAVSRLDAHWARRRLVVVVVIVGLGPLLSTASVLGGSAALAAVVAVAVLERRRLREVLLASAVALVTLVVVVLATVQRNASGSLRGFWAAYFLPRSFHPLLTLVWRRVREAAPYTGVPHPVLVLVLCGAGVVALWRRDRRAAALVVPLACAATTVAGTLHIYPFLDIRTSTWLLVGVVLLMGTGVVELVRVLRGIGARLAGGRRGAVPAAALALATLAYGGQQARPWVRVHPIFAQDVRAQARYVAAHEKPGDAVVVAFSANWAYAYYSPLDPVPVVHSRLVATGFLADFSGDPRVVAMTGRGPAAVGAAVAQGVRAAAGGSRIWVVRTQIAADERPVWDAVVARCGAALAVGIDPLLLLDPSRGC